MITVILNCYKRLNYLEEQIKAIENQTVKPFDIWIWYNNPEDGSQINLNEKLQGKYKVIQSNHNFNFFGRFGLATLAQTEYVAIFDDDTIPAPKWFELCLNTMNEVGDGILGGAGVRLNSSIYNGHTKIGWNYNPPSVTTEVDLVGHAWFFKKSSLKYFFMEEPKSWENAEDCHFSAMCQKYGNLKTYVPAIAHKPDCNPSYKGDYGRDKNASYLIKNGHMSVRNNVCKSLCDEGWKRSWRK